MAQITLSINGRNYPVTCDDGQESHLQQLGEYLDARVQELAAAVGQVGESRLLVMAGLLIADELIDARTQQNNAAVAAPAQAALPLDEAASQALDACARRIEDIAERLQSA